MSKDVVRTEISTLGEFGLINHLTKEIKLNNPESVLGVGDDACGGECPSRAGKIREIRERKRGKKPRPPRARGACLRGDNFWVILVPALRIFGFMGLEICQIFPDGAFGSVACALPFYQVKDLKNLS